MNGERKMTKEELRKEATTTVQWEYTPMIDRPTFCNGYLAGAEPREKQIQIDAEQIRALQKQNGELTDKVKELEAQIEKMKCGQNCKHSYLYQKDRKCKFTYCDCVNCKHKWEIKEK